MMPPCRRITQAMASITIRKLSGSRRMGWLPDAEIDTSDIPEVVNWSDVQRSENA